jgi:hypothetical protein
VSRMGTGSFAVASSSSHLTSLCVGYVTASERRNILSIARQSIPVP